MEQKLSAGLGQRQVAELVEDDEVHSVQMLGDTTLSSVAGLDLKQALSTSRRNMSVLMMKGIEDAGIGKRVVGRRGAPARILWRCTWKSIAQVTRKESGAEALRPPDSKETLSRQPRIEHSCLLQHEEDDHADARYLACWRQAAEAGSAAPDRYQG